LDQGSDDVEEEEPILETRWMVPNIGRDLLILENQLPMFVLQEIYEITVSKVWLTFVDKWAHSPIIMLTLIMMSTPKDETHHNVYTHHG
jgi:hypothetical protein